MKKGNDFFFVWLQFLVVILVMEMGFGLFDVQLEVLDLWILGFDGQEYNYEQWLIRLVCILIESGFVQDEIFFILFFMCKIKVIFDLVRFMYIMFFCVYELIWFYWEVYYEEELYFLIFDYLKKVKDVKKMKYLLI